MLLFIDITMYSTTDLAGF